MTFTGTRVYNHLEPTPQNAQMQGQMIQPDAWAREHQQKMLREYAQAGTMNPGGTWAKKSVTVRDANGQLWHKQVEAMVNYACLPVPPGEQIAYQMLMQNQARMREMRESNAQTQQRVNNLRIIVDRD